MNNLYHQGQAQLQTTLARFQSIQNELRHAHIQNIEIQKELDKERNTCELVNQQLLEMKEKHGNLQKDQEEAVALQAQLTRSIEEYRSYAEEVSRQAEETINGLCAGITKGEDGEEHNGQSISAMIMQSAKNALFVEATTRGYSETDILHRLKYAIDQNAAIQLRIESLSGALETRDRELETRDRQLGARSKELEARDKEISSLNKALELSSEGGKQTRPRRGVKQRKLMSRVDSI
jgi:phage shock protein A